MVGRGESSGLVHVVRDAVGVEEGERCCVPRHLPSQSLVGGLLRCSSSCTPEIAYSSTLSRHDDIARLGAYERQLLQAAPMLLCRRAILRSPCLRRGSHRFLSCR